MVGRRGFLTGAAAALAAPRLARAGAGIEARDVLGNRVALPAPPERIVLLDATDLISMAALIAEPGARLAGWASVPRLDLGRAAWLAPEGLPVVGKLSPDTVSAEGILALSPDLVVASAYMLPPGGSVLESVLRAAGIPLAWTGGHDRALPPGDKLDRAMGFWGAVLDRPQTARELAAWGRARFDAVRAATSGPRPRTYMEIMSTYDTCCWAAGHAFWGGIFEIAGGHLLEASDGWGAKLGPEGLIAFDPEVYIATGGSFAPELQPGIAPGLDPGQGREGLARAAARPALKDSAATRAGRVHGIWSGLATAPLMAPVLADCLGAWLHPETGANLDPRRTLTALNDRFARPLPGPLWLSLDAA
ncbi:ABC transporter substrate-binding protein [Rhodovulum sulfidophilum]|uniref:ABC transporter substrate-binding protein n=1 Tax=Rhodovulum sulfidophilum TaxID=35806 RepID=UPI0019239C98|nr:ABC transporter substrate-binding protein [Rhodovulum sulfidophilum]MBL3574689.1 ABC transporter substrate-binding protein [Rhodovulum sulfidophilum]MCE8430228.1 ABC transporter substrate-binding protein [Rhodovulum sulfidophilum]MCF4115538.1 ABC transporter substrate-binding protein [Rhodovulum sulfidophilum]